MNVPIPVRWLIAASFVVLVIVLSVTPGQVQTGDSVFVWLVVNTPTLLQKLMHIAVYALLVLLLAWSLQGIASRNVRLLLAVILAVSLGAILEWYQIRIPGRFGTLLDVLLNAGGAILGLLAALLVL